MREMELDDPMQPMGETLIGDPELMLTCIVEEYMALGYNEASLLKMFADPFFQAAKLLRERFGLEGVAERVSREFERCGMINVKIHAAVEEPLGSSERAEAISLIPMTEISC